ncbi:MAG: hypothetical protein AVDCRST_MAG67-222 [uncultured Solirubrobacteraceae bacterium]|uniref:Uncharacterized protein n=1 Tax=uncultured Solirubrobacteraceae bacterium TaxID=1162706 RepID=A0A6J4RHL4_9ACTN|nr:MAG: hypothetical protein AVDCRST_MAG67-222 [uncultured Solirubrobacteraceae bacterium]
MGRLRKLSQGERIVLVAGVLLIADLLILPWHDIELGGRLEGLVDTTLSAVQEPYAGYGIAAVVLTAVMVVQIVLTRLLSVRLPAPPVPWSQIHLILGIFVAVVLVIKLVRLTDSLGYGAYSGVLAGILVAYGAWSMSREGEEPL